MKDALISLINDYKNTGNMAAYDEAVEMVESNYEDLVKIAEANGLNY